MGEARNRAAVYQRAKDKLLEEVTGDARVVAETAIRLFEGYVLPQRYTGGCYLTTMTLHWFLQHERGIITEPVVGYVNDATDDIMISHAWLEHDGLKVDLTLHLTDGFSTGALLVLDHVLRPGRLVYTYHRERTPAGIAQDRVMMRDPEIAPVLRHKQAEHQTMSGIARDSKRLGDYLAVAPAQMSYDVLAKAMRG
jgi:hypothetical protein